MLFLDCMLDTLNDCTLSFYADLLGALEGNKGHLQIVRRLLQRSLMRGLSMCVSATADDCGHTI